MERKYIKYFYGSYRAAKSKGLSSEYLFYLKLKTLKDGELRIGSINKSIEEASTLSPASITIYLKKLVTAGFLIPYVIKGKVVGYQVISYKRALKLIGVKIRFSGAKKNIAKSHRYQGINVEGLEDTKKFKNFIELLDVHKNSKNQAHKEKTKINRKIKYQRTKDNSPETLGRIKQLREDHKSCMMRGGIQNKISCGNLAKLLGFKSIQQGSLIERRGEANGFFTIKRNFEVVESRVSYIDYIPMKAIDNSLYWMFGNVVQNDCNILTLTQEFFSYFVNNNQRTSYPLSKAKSTPKSIPNAF